MSGTRTVVVRKGDGVRDFEQHMCDVLRGETVLRVPRTISYAGSLGRSVSFAQMIATWATRSSQPRALTTLSADGGKRSREICLPPPWPSRCILRHQHYRC